MKSSKSALLLFLGSLLVFTTGFAAVSTAGVDGDVGINVPLPLFVLPAPPPVIVIPNSYIYYVPDIGVDLLFYHGYWYRPHQGYWYRSRSYNGPWAYMPPRMVPPALVGLPPNWHTPPGHQPIPYRQLRRNWYRWERDRYWYQRGWDNEGRRGGSGGRGFEDHGAPPSWGTW